LRAIVKNQSGVNNWPQKLPKAAHAVARSWVAGRQSETQHLPGGNTTAERPRACFVIDFNGARDATAQVDDLRLAVSLVLQVAEPDRGDEVVVLLESRGGTVESYGLGAAQLARLKDANISLTVCVDKVATSGGYMMACVADRLVASPFAMVGSIGVFGSIINAHESLRRLGLEPVTLKAGKKKNNLDMLGKITPEGLEQQQQQIDRIHKAFKQHILHFRPQVEASFDEVTDGDVWLGLEAVGLGLVDELQPSDSLLATKMRSTSSNIDSTAAAPPPQLVVKLEKREKTRGVWGRARTGVQSLSSLSRIAKLHSALLR